MTVSQSPQTYFGAVPPPGGPGSVWATRDHRTVESAYVMATTAALTSQVTEGAGVTIDGSADVGLYIDGALYSATTPATVAAFAVALNLIPAFAAIAVASIPSGTTLRVTFLDYKLHTVTSYTPGAPDITAITDTVAATNPTYVLPGQGVCIDTAAPGGGEVLTVKLPTTAAEAARCIGVVGTDIFGIASPAGLLGQGYDPVLGIPPGKAFALHREDNVRVRLGATVTKDDTASLGYTAATRGLWYPSANATGTVQVTRGDVVFNGTDNVGLTVDSLPDLFVASDTSDDITVVALRNAWNASAQHFDVATATSDISGAPSYIILTFKDTAAHTVVAYSPATADVTGITNTTAAVAATTGAVPNVRYAKAATLAVGSAPAEVALD